MGIEIEKKFLVKNNSWKKVEGIYYLQGYLTTEGVTVRARIVKDLAWLTIKGKGAGAVRPEFEYEIPVEDARFILENLCQKPLIEKHRYFVEDEGLVWEVDEFHGENEGLVVAELELESENVEIVKPEWVGDEVTHDRRYANASLVKNPYNNW